MNNIERRSLLILAHQAGGNVAAELLEAFENPLEYVWDKSLQWVADWAIGSDDDPSDISDDEEEFDFDHHNSGLIRQSNRQSNRHAEGMEQTQHFWNPLFQQATDTGNEQYERTKQKMWRDRMRGPQRAPKINFRMCPEGYRFDAVTKTCVPDEKYLIFS